ncbi:MAG TPA: FAD-dependent oxidoreductase, partial [Candidatus Limnocylindrales bacterium]|nr:FAD-dependent oxidoreductase [Candidatus Limnocylindrales bacterium]
MSGYVIIGNSTAGLAGAQALRQHDPCAKITVISGEPHLPYSRVLLTHLIAGHVVRDQLDLTGPEFMDRLGITLLSGSRAVNVELNLKEVLLDSGEKLQYKSLLVAAGSRPVFPDGFSGENPAITGLRTIDDAIKICRHVVPGAKIIVVGGGPVGVKLACALREAGTMPEIIVSSPNLLSQVSDDEAARMVQAMLTSRG